MKNFNDDTFLARWLSNELTPEERSAFEASEDYKVYQKIVAGASLFESPDILDEGELLEKVKALKKPQPEGLTLTRRYWLYGMAATIALVIASYFAFDLITHQSYASNYGERKTAVLPDGTEVILNSQSEISFQRWNWKDNRQVRLDGEAFFKVVRGSTFTVNSDHGSITVLGTQFNVKSMQDLIEVTCYEGSVRVNTLLHEQTLSSGKGFRQIADDTALLETKSTEPSWLGNESTFKNIPARYVLNALENQYEIYFEGRLPDDLIFTGSFPHNDRDLALKVVLGALQIEYTIREENIIELGSKK